MIVEPIVGVERTAVPEVLSVAVKFVGTGFGDKVGVRSGHQTIFALISVADDRCRGNVVGSQKKIGGSRVVEVEERIVVILAVNSEHVGGAGNPVDRAIPVTRLRVHGYTGRGLQVVAEIVAGIGNVCDLLGTQGSRNISVFCLDHVGAGSDLNRSAGCSDCQL